MFIKRDNDARQVRHPEEPCDEKLVRDGMQCANVGILRSDPDIVCCLSYHDEHTGSGETFFKGTCKKYHCPAWSELTDRQVLFAAELMKDWYFYSLLINAIELTTDLCADYEHPDDVPSEILDELKIELTSRLEENELF
jgi:hypothetical protein